MRFPFSGITAFLTCSILVLGLIGQKGMSNTLDQNQLHFDKIKSDETISDGTFRNYLSQTAGEYSQRYLPIEPAKTQDDASIVYSYASAPDIVIDIAKHYKKNRVQCGLFNFSLSAFWIAVGLIDREGDNLVINGHFYYNDIDGDSPTTRESFGFAGLYALMGIGYFGSSSLAEIQYKRISSISDSASRQLEAAEALKIIAKKEKRSRISRSLFSFAMSAAYVTFRPLQTSHNNDSILNLLFGTYNLFVGVYNISTPSYAETALRNFQVNQQSIDPLKVQIRSNYKNEIGLVFFKNI